MIDGQEVLDRVHPPPHRSLTTSVTNTSWVWSIDVDIAVPAGPTPIAAAAAILLARRTQAQGPRGAQEVCLPAIARPPRHSVPAQAHRVGGRQHEYVPRLDSLRVREHRSLARSMRCLSDIEHLIDQAHSFALFRETTVSSLLISSYAHVIGGRFLRAVLQVPLLTALESKWTTDSDEVRIDRGYLW